MVRFRFVLPLVAALFAVTAAATGQITDEILVNDEPRPLLDDPLAGVIFRAQIEGRMRAYREEDQCTASVRGYRGFWRLQGDRLELVKLVIDACRKNPREVPLGVVFPGQTSPMLAKWFTGRLVIPMGRNLRQGPSIWPQYERYLILAVFEGTVTSRTETTELPR